MITKRTLLAAVTLLLFFTLPAWAGLYVEQTVSSSVKGMNMEVKAWSEGPNARVDYVKSDSPIMPAGSYLITTDGGKTAYLVNPEKKTYAPWDLDAIFNTFRQSTSDLIKLDFSDVKSETLPSQPGGKILGYDTTLDSWRSSYTMNIKVMMMERHQHTESLTKAWVTDAVSNPALKIWLAVKPPTTGNEEFDKMLSDSMNQIHGTPLKLVQDSTMTNKKGRSQKNTMTMEVTKLQQGPVDAGLFVMPKGYTKVSLLQLAADNEQDGQKQESGKKESPLSKLGGLFKKKKHQQD